MKRNYRILQTYPRGTAPLMRCYVTSRVLIELGERPYVANALWDTGSTNSAVLQENIAHTYNIYTREGRPCTGKVRGLFFLSRARVGMAVQAMRTIRADMAQFSP